MKKTIQTRRSRDAGKRRYGDEECQMRIVDCRIQITKQGIEESGIKYSSQFCSFFYCNCSIIYCNLS